MHNINRLFFQISQNLKFKVRFLLLFSSFLLRQGLISQIKGDFNVNNLCNLLEKATDILKKNQELKKDNIKTVQGERLTKKGGQGGNEV